MTVPEYLFEFNDFRMNIANLIKANYSNNGKLGFGNSFHPFDDSFPTPS